MIGNLNGRMPMNVRGFAENNENFQERLDEWHNLDAYILFDGWVGKSRTDWVEFKNDIGTKIEFYSKTYKINGIELPYPQTLDNFITDCKRLNIDLEWRRDLIDQGMNIYHLVDGKVAEEFVIEMLTIMDKI